MLNISGLENGYVIDHIPAGLSLSIYHYLDLDKYSNSIAIIKNVKSNKIGKKDIIKIEGLTDSIQLDLLSVFAESITINQIENGVINRKYFPNLPETVTSLFECKNPRCITSVERGIKHSFRLSNSNRRAYRCIYCDQEHKLKPKEAK